MIILYKLVGSLIVPPGLFIILLLLAGYLAGKAPPKRPGISIALAALAFATYFMSAPFGSALITGTVESMCETNLPPDDAPAMIIALAEGVVYDGAGVAVAPSPGAYVRTAAAVNLAKSRKGQSVLVMTGGDTFGKTKRSGGDVMRAAARNDMGYKEYIIVEDRSRTTAENMRRCAEIVKRTKAENVVIVTNAYHMPRAMKTAEIAMPDVNLYSYVGGRRTDPLIIRGASSFIPTAVDFYMSCLGIKEWIGIAVARIL